MRTLSKLLITRYEGRVLTARIQNGKVIQMDLEPSEASGRLGNIYIGKVKNIVKNINAAFVDLGGGQINILNLMVRCGLCASKGEARRLVQQGGVSVNDRKVESIDETLGCEQFTGEGVIIRKGKKVFHRALLV